MPNELIGRQHRAVLEQLAGPWWREGPPVCFLEGFPGVGKSNAILPRLRTKVIGHSAKAVTVDMPEAGTSQLDDLLLDLAQELSFVGLPGVADALDGGLPLAGVSGAFLSIFEHPVLVVWDEFQRALDPQGEPLPPIKTLLGRIARHSDLPGRLLLLTNRKPRRGQWSDAHRIIPVSRLDAEDGLAFLHERLRDAGIEEAIPHERRADVVAWAGGNPRALQLVVAALARSSLIDLIGLLPEIWELRDREVSPALVEDLNRELLKKILDSLDPASRRMLYLASVYRKPVRREALDALAPPGEDPERVRRELADRALLEVPQGGRYALNPVAQEVVRRLLTGDSAQLRRAHELAGEHYARHFKAVQITGGGRLGGYFVEARYHLVQAGREEDLRGIAERFSSHLKADTGPASKVPSDPRERDERIAVLSALLEQPGPKGLEYHLARCLYARQQGKDRERALEHARRATGAQAPADAWVLRIRLEAELSGPGAALEATEQGLKWVSADQNAPLYQAGADALGRKGNLDGALRLLREGIAKIPAAQLYQAAGELLAKQGKLDEAVLLLKEGIAKIPADKSLQSLYQVAGELLEKQDKLDDAVLLLKEGIAKIPADKSLQSLYQVAGELLAKQGKLDKAVLLLKEGIAKIPAAPLYQAAGELLAKQDKLDEAVLLLKDGIAKIPADRSLYQAAGELLARQDKLDEAVLLLKDGIAKIPADKNRYRVIESALYLSAAGRRPDLIDGISASRDPMSQALARSLRLILVNDWLGAAEAAHSGRELRKSYLTLCAQEAFCWLAAGDAGHAKLALDEFPGIIHSLGNPTTWLAALVALRMGDSAKAKEYYCTLLGLVPAEQAAPTLLDLLRIWNSPAPLSTPHPAYYFSTLPPSLTGLSEPITRPPTWEPALLPLLRESSETSPSLPPFGSLRVLAIATEWFSRRGGLSTFNRELCAALARAGQQVVCLVPKATDKEVSHARAQGVELLSAPPMPGADELAGLLRRPPGSFTPDVILGHSRITGPAARAQVEDFFPAASRIHMIHMAPEEIEWHKGKPGAATRAEERAQIEAELARSAKLVVAVGPRLFRSVGTMLADPTIPLHRLDPGLTPAGDREPPPGIEVLLLGRAEDFELKGLDIAARAIAQVSDPTRPLEHEPVLVIRGAPIGTGDRLHRQLLDLAKLPADRVQVREYSAEAERLTQDLRRASLLLMPSRVEGFGLVGLEAIAAGTPVLVSDRSGLAELLREDLSAANAPSFIVQTTGEVEKDAAEWARAMEYVLRDRKAAFARTRELREKLAKKLSWTQAVNGLVKALADVGVKPGKA